MNPNPREERLARLYDAHAARVHAYLVRQCGRDAADDVLSEVVIVLMRRLDDVPDDALPWLLVTARKLASNHRRSLRRREQVHALLASQPSTAVSVEGPGVDRLELAAAFATLTDREQEAILLTTWDGLSLADAAMVAGCGERAFRGRLGRARRRLATSLGEPPPRTGHPPLPYSPDLPALDEGAPA